MKVDELARVVKDARLVPRGDAVIVLRIERDLDELERRALDSLCTEVFGPKEGRPPVLALQGDMTLSSIEVSGALAVMRCLFPLSNEARAVLEEYWRGAWAASGLPAPPVVVVGTDLDIEPAASAPAAAVTQALLDTRGRPSAQDQAAALLECFWIIPKPAVSA